MNIRLAWASAIGVLALAAPALAHTVNCTVDSDRLQETLSRLERGSTLTIKGNCVGNVTVATDGVSLVAHPSGGTITGQVEVTAQRVSFTGIDIMGPEPSDPNTIVRAGLFAHDGASVTFANGAIANHSRSGILANRGASVIVRASRITGNGTASVPNDADGVQAIDAGSVLLGGVDANNDAIASAGDEIAGNAARGVLAARAGAIRILAGNVHDNGSQAVQAAFGGSIGINGGTFSVPTPAVGVASDVMLAVLGGSIDIQNASGNGVGTITGTTTVTGSAGGVIAADSGTARVRSATVITSGAKNVDPALGAFRGASLHVEGANTIDNTNSTPGGGWALEISDSATLRVDDTNGFSSAANKISGAVGIFNLSSMRIADFNPASSIAGSFTVSVNSLLSLQRANITTGDISVVGPSTLNAGPGPIGFSGTLRCFSSTQVNPVAPTLIGVPVPFNPPKVGC
jgi:hypothetical protein